MHKGKRIFFIILVIGIIFAITLGIINYNKMNNKSMNDVTNNVKIEGSNDNSKVEWNEISSAGVNENMLLQNIDSDILKEVASEFQNLCEEIEEKQREYPESVLRGDWVNDIIASPQYKAVINIGSNAMKPLYWIIYKSENQGLYEYICALALEELSGFNFDMDDDGIKWSTSKEFLQEFNNRILD